MLMILGEFIFSVDSAAYDSFERNASFKWSAHERVGKRSTHQYLGVDDEDISLSGVIFGELAKGDAIFVLREMAAGGNPFFLISGTGMILGEFLILSIKDKRSFFFNDGTAQKIEFSLTLRRYDEVTDTITTIFDELFS